MEQPGRREKTLVIQPLPGIGDMVWHLPHIHAVAKAAGGPVTILTKARSRAAELLEADASVAGVLRLERNPGKHDGVSGFFRLVALLRAGRFDAAWVLHSSSRYALAALAAGIPRRWGCAAGWQKALFTGPEGFPAHARSAHPITKADLLLKLAGLSPLEPEPRLPVSPSAVARARLSHADLPRPWVALGLGSSEPEKQWGAARFTELAQGLAALGPASFFLVGGPAEAPLAREIASRLSPARVREMIGAPLGDVSALLSECAAYVGNDTGAMNLAAAVGTPAVALFGASPPLCHSRLIHAVLPEPPGSGMAGISVAAALARLSAIVRGATP